MSITEGISIIQYNLKDLNELLNKAFADEWLAYYQYWIGSKIVEGPMTDVVKKELAQHATEELAHATLLATRIQQIEGSLILNPKDFASYANCGYATPTDSYVEKILAQNIEGEQCAIRVYHHMMQLTKDKDPVTYDLARRILEDEIEHERDLMDLLKDLKLLLSYR